MTKVVIVDSQVYDSTRDKVIVDSFTTDVIPVKYTNGMTKEELYTAIGDVTDVSQIAFLYHFPGFCRLPFFYDDVPQQDPTGQEPVSPPQAKYHFYSDKVIEIITALRDGRKEELKASEFVVDIISCNLDTPEYIDEVHTIENDLGINIRFSVDATGNPADGGNWVMESESPTVNIRDQYFTDGILNWTGILSSDISATLKANTTYAEFILWDNATKTYTLQKDCSISDIGGASSCIRLGPGEIFDGNGYTIDASSSTSFNGIFTISTSVTSFATAPQIKRLGILGGTLAANAGYFLVQNSKYFKIENCYSTGKIGGAGGGIAGKNPATGAGGKCIISNCYSTGEIGGPLAYYCGGIVGQNAGGGNGDCTIINCYTTGNTSSLATDPAGIAGADAGTYGGNCTIKNCYSTGRLYGHRPSGIIGKDSSGADGTGKCTIENCYNTGNINDGYEAANIYHSKIRLTQENFIINNCVGNGRLTFSGTFTGTNNSTDLADITNKIYNGWSTDVWQSTTTTPILKGFTSNPWDSTSYTVPTAAAVFLKVAPTLSAFSVDTKTFGSSPFSLIAPSSNSTGAFSYTSSNPSVATISGSTVTIVGAGSTIITATQDATSNYSNGTITASFNVTPLAPTLSAFSVDTKTFGSSPFSLIAPSSNSTGAFSYTSSNPSVATISGSTVTIVGAGSTIITATQDATSNYSNGTITASFNVTPLAPTLSAFSVDTKTFGSSPFSLIAPSSNSTGAFSYTSSNPSVATISGSTVTIVGAGSTIITATQDATSNYSNGTITALFIVNPAPVPPVAPVAPVAPVPPAPVAPVAPVPEPSPSQAPSLAPTLVPVLNQVQVIAPIAILEAVTSVDNNAQNSTYSGEYIAITRSGTTLVKAVSDFYASAAAGLARPNAPPIFKTYQQMMDYKQRQARR